MGGLMAEQDLEKVFNKWRGLEEMDLPAGMEHGELKRLREIVKEKDKEIETLKLKLDDSQELIRLLKARIACIPMEGTVS